MSFEFETIKQTLATKNSQNFFERVWLTPQSVYRKRLQAIGFRDKSSVLDAGCGFGQWSIALAGLNRSVTGIDPSQERIAASRQMAGALKVQNVDFLQATIEKMPFGDDAFEAIFSYSVLYFTDYRKTLRKLFSSLKPGGLFYFTTNGLGWYLYNLIEGHNDADDFSSRQMAIDAFENSLKYYATAEHTDGRSIIMPRELVLEDLRAIGFQVLASGADGSIGRGKYEIQSFYDEQKYGLESAYEVLCRK